MTSRTVEFYENKITMFTNKHIAELLQISEEEVSAAAASSSDLSERYVVTVNFLIHLLVLVIQDLMEEYCAPPVSTSYFVRNLRAITTNVKKEQQAVAVAVARACEFYSLTPRLHSHPEFRQQCIDFIKEKLESGLFASNLHPQDEYLKLVKAIVNKTTGLDGWEFNSEAVEKLDGRQNSNRPRM